ncbi:MAG: cytochrome c biogenesis protein CcsA, partial [Actinomycetota bacterium]
MQSTRPHSATGTAINRLGIVAWAAVAVSLFLTFFVARPAVAAMGGEIQRIFYVHVPSAWLAYLSFAIVFVSSVAYLRTDAR